MLSSKFTLKLQKFAEKTAIKAGKYLFKNQDRVKIIKKKKLQDILTNIDIEAQQIIVTEIENNYPDHGIIAEENNLKIIRDLTWTVDPLDGTKYYSKGLNAYGTPLGLFYKSKPIVGVVYYPAENSLYSGSLGNGAFFNGSRISPSNTVRLDKSMVYATLPNIGMSKPTFSKTLKGVEKLFRNCYRARYLADANMAMSWVAHGAFEAFVDLSGDQPVWDIGGGFGILNAVGGKITDLKGNLIKNFNLSKGIIASNGKIHSQLVKLLS